MRTYYGLAPAVCLILLVTGAAHAQKLNVSEVQALLAKGPWKIELGGGTYYFLWSSSGKLCVKQYGPKDEMCADLGTWERDGTKICYKLKWWGKSDDMHDLCFEVAKAKSGGFNAQDSRGLTNFHFSVIPLK